MYSVYVHTYDAAAINPATGETVLPSIKSSACVMKTKDRKEALRHASTIFQREADFLNGTSGDDISVTVQWEEE